ncbi:MAG: hypothetical protein ABIR08_10355 [Sphingomonas sp.]
MDQDPNKQVDERDGADRRQEDDPEYPGPERRVKDRRKEPRKPA